MVSPYSRIAPVFDTLNLLIAPEDLRLAFYNVASNLRPGGHFYSTF